MDFYVRQLKKNVKSRKDVPFGGLIDVALNFGVKPPKNCNFGGVNRTFKLERQKIQTLISYLKTTQPIMTKFLHGVRTTSVPLWVVPWLPNKSKMAAAAIFNFGKNVNNSRLNKDIGTNFYGKMYHGYAEMTT